MKHFFMLIKIVLVVSVYSNIAGCNKEIPIGNWKSSIVQENIITNPNTINKIESSSSVKDINTYHDEKFGFSVDFPRGVGLSNKQIHRTF